MHFLHDGQGNLPIASSQAAGIQLHMLDHAVQGHSVYEHQAYMQDICTDELLALCLDGLVCRRSGVITCEAHSLRCGSSLL